MDLSAGAESAPVGGCYERDNNTGDNQSQEKEAVAATHGTAPAGCFKCGEITISKLLLYHMLGKNNTEVRWNSLTKLQGVKLSLSSEENLLTIDMAGRTIYLQVMG